MLRLSTSLSSSSKGLFDIWLAHILCALVIIVCSGLGVKSRLDGREAEMIEQIEPLTLTECMAMRGVSSMLVLTSHFWPKGYVWFMGNHGYYFDRDNKEMLRSLRRPDYVLPLRIMQRFGVYGVPIFFFLSGFGLARKYESKSAERISALRFLRFHYLKLWRSFILGFVIAQTLSEQGGRPRRYTWGEFLQTVGLYRITMPSRYWYLGATWQLYVIYGLAIYRWRS